MKSELKRFLGWMSLLVISLIPIFLLFLLGPEAKELNNYASITHTLGENVRWFGSWLKARW